MLKDIYTQTTRVIERIADTVKLSEPMQNKFLETIIAITSDLGKPKVLKFFFVWLNRIPLTFLLDAIRLDITLWT